MLLIFGVRVRSRVIGTGTFHCPSCGGDRTYAHKHARRWFTVFFIPIVPMGDLGEYVQCETCQRGFQMDVLDRPTSASLAEQMIAATREAVAQLILLDDRASTREAGMRTLSEITGQEIDADQLQADVDHLDLSQLSPRLRILSEVLNEHGKERFLTSVTCVAAGGGILGSSSREALEAYARELGMTPAHARGVIEIAVESLQG